jgi:hypothetical protein
MPRVPWCKPAKASSISHSTPATERSHTLRRHRPNILAASRCRFLAHRVRLTRRRVRPHDRAVAPHPSGRGEQQAGRREPLSSVEASGRAEVNLAEGAIGEDQHVAWVRISVEDPYGSTCSRQGARSSRASDDRVDCDRLRARSGLTGSSPYRATIPVGVSPPSSAMVIRPMRRGYRSLVARYWVALGWSCSWPTFLLGGVEDAARSA